METTTASALARSIMNEHGLTTWTFQFDRAKRRLGMCSHRTQTISLSAPLTRLNDEERIRNTILHEIAHALVGPGHKHDHVWRRQARAIGCDGRTCVDTEEIVTAPTAWVGICPCCLTKVGRHRLTDKARRVACSACCKQFARGRYDERFKFEWHRQRIAA